MPLTIWPASFKRLLIKEVIGGRLLWRELKLGQWGHKWLLTCTLLSISKYASCWLQYIWAYISGHSFLYRSLRHLVIIWAEGEIQYGNKRFTLPLSETYIPPLPCNHAADLFWSSLHQQIYKFWGRRGENFREPPSFKTSLCHPLPVSPQPAIGVFDISIIYIDNIYR